METAKQFLLKLYFSGTVYQGLFTPLSVVCQLGGEQSGTHCSQCIVYRVPSPWRQLGWFIHSAALYDLHLIICVLQGYILEEFC